MNQRSLLLALSVIYVRAQVQYYENNTMLVPIWHFFKTRKPEWANWTAPSTIPALNWVDYHTQQSIQYIQDMKRSSTTARTKEPTTPYPLVSIGIDRLFNLSWEAEALKNRLDYEYELDNNMSLTTEPTIDPSYIPPSPRIFNLYKGVYLNDSSFEAKFWNKSYYERFNRSINWSKKKAYWKKTPTTPSTEWEFINITKIGDWERIECELNDISYWDSQRQREEYEHHYYMQDLAKQNKTPTTEQVTPLIKLLANTRIASLWQLHSILPFLNQKTTFIPPDTAEQRDLIYSEEFPVSPVIELPHDEGPTDESFGGSKEYDYRDQSKMFGSNAEKYQEYTKLWDERYFQQHFPQDMPTKMLEMPTHPDPWQQWLAMDTWSRREYILRGWNTIKPDFEIPRAVPMVFTPHPNPTTWDYYDYQEYTPLEALYNEVETTRMSSREISMIIWSEKQWVATTTRPTTTLAPGETPMRRPKKKKVWTTAKPVKSVKKRYNRTMSQQEIKRMMREKYKKINEMKAEKQKEKEAEAKIDAKFDNLGDGGVGDDMPATEPYVTAPDEFVFENKLPVTKEPLKEYQCHICLKELSSKGGYQRHINTHKRMGQWIDPPV